MGDLGEQFGFAILNRAFRMVMDGAELIALQKNRFWLTADGLSLDAGPFVAAIEYASGIGGVRRRKALGVVLRAGARRPRQRYRGGADGR